LGKKKKKTGPLKDTSETRGGAITLKKNPKGGTPRRIGGGGVGGPSPRKSWGERTLREKPKRDSSPKLSEIESHSPVWEEGKNPWRLKKLPPDAKRGTRTEQVEPVGKGGRQLAGAEKVRKTNRTRGGGGMGKNTS